MQHNPYTPRPRVPIGIIVVLVIMALIPIIAVLIWLAWQWQTLDAALPWLTMVLRVAFFTVPPVYVLAFVWQRWGRTRYIDAFHVQQLTKAHVQVAPLATSFHFAPHHEQVSAPDAPQLEVSADDIPALPLTVAGRSRIEQLRGLGHICRSGNSLLTGYTEGKPSYIELSECGFIGVGGQPRVGKSSTSLLLIEQAILSDWHVFVGDPHVQKADGLLSRCKPFSGRLAKQAVTPDEISDMIRLVDKIGRRRVEGDSNRTPVLMIIDEFSNLVWRGMLPADVLGILPSMAAEYAGVGVHGVLIAHDWSKASLGGDLGAAVRRAITHRLIHRMDAGNVEFLLPKSSSAQARAVTNLDVGRALYWGLEGAQMVAVPWVGEDDARYAAQGAPERPYSPPARKPAQLQATAPTMPLTLTVQDQIVGVLSARPWLSSTEIATALNIDVKVIRTEIASLKKQLDRRETPRGSADRFAYALRGQPVNQSSSP
jgi:hypothetical protein